MPFKTGKSKAVFNSNVSEGMKSYKQKGTFGNSKPANKKQALRQILAAAYAKKRKSKGTSKGKAWKKPKQKTKYA